MSCSGFSLLFSCIYMRCKCGIFKMTAATEMMKAKYRMFEHHFLKSKNCCCEEKRERKKKTKTLFLLSCTFHKKI